MGSGTGGVGVNAPRRTTAAMPERPTDAGLKPPAKADGERTRETQSGLWRLFGAMPRGWAIAILAVAAWIALVLIVLGLLRLFSG